MSGLNFSQIELPMAREDNYRKTKKGHKMRKVLIVSMMLVSLPVRADFCVINNFGQQMSCHPTLDACRMFARSTPGGGCVLVGNSAPGPSTGGLGGALMEMGRQMQQQAADEQQQQKKLQGERGRMPAFLVPLVASDSSMSQESITIISSTLQTALEMDQGYSRRDWRNSNTGSFGVVEVNPQAINQYGDPCREYSLSLTDTTRTTRTSSGTACRQGSQWRVFAGASIEKRGTQSQPAIQKGVAQNTFRSVNEGGSCATSYECSVGSCISGICKRLQPSR